MARSTTRPTRRDDLRERVLFTALSLALIAALLAALIGIASVGERAARSNAQRRPLADAPHVALGVAARSGAGDCRAPPAHVRRSIALVELGGHPCALPR